MVLPNWGKNWVFFQISVYKLSWLLKNLLCHSYVLTRVSKYHSLEKHLLASAWFLSWGKKQKLLAAALFMSDGYTVYILKRLECEQLCLFFLTKSPIVYINCIFITKEMSASPSSSPAVLARHTPCSAHPPGCPPSTVQLEPRVLPAVAAGEWNLQEGTRKVASA